MLQGKGLWAYREGEVGRALEIGPQIGATHVLWKVGHGSTVFDGTGQVAAQIKQAGLVPLGWTWLLLDDPRAEAQVAVRAFEQGFEGLVFDTEAEACQGRFDEAIELGRHLVDAGLDLQALYNCSFPNITNHQNLPYEPLNAVCRGGLMPMAYGTFFEPGSTVPPAQQARRVIDEWTYGHHATWSQRWGYAPPLYPVLGPYHDEHATFRMPPEEFQLWLDRLEAHKPTFFSLFRAGVLNDDLLPLVQAFSLGEMTPPAPAGLEVVVTSLELGYLNVRPTPSTERPPIAHVRDGDTILSLEPDEVTLAKVGRDNRWLHIRTPQGILGYVAAWYLRLAQDESPPRPGETQLRLEVVSPELGYLNVRPAPSLGGEPAGQVEDGTLLTSLESAHETRTKTGLQEAWIRVRTPDGVEGYVAAWYVRLYSDAPIIGEPVNYLVVRSDIGLNVRQRPGTGPEFPIVWHVEDGTVLEVLENPVMAGGKVGRDAWIKVRTPSQREGYVNALYVRAEHSPDRRRPAHDTGLSQGECAWIYGIHAAGATTPADFRFLFAESGRTGWVLFTEAIGADPNHGGSHDYTSWSEDGYGVLVRLNHGYHGAGTLPVRAEYPDFARACGRYVEDSRGCHIWIIGNEQNNVREHPGGAEAPVEHITPEMYAEAFNLARREIKAAQPEAIVVPGAVDPYNTYPWALAGGQRYRPLEYFKRMLSCIEDLDGIALHTYTHWFDVRLITKLTVFEDEFLPPGTPREHYYDFQAYRPFVEAIPPRWRNVPVYITETNHWLALEREPQNEAEKQQVGWVNKNKGWVQAAYAEINRWNSAPHRQQIQCLLLYRWTGDAWAIESAGEIHQDFKQAVEQDYRWRT